jgi:ADP-heptose:LPS heptosyltransferase
MKQVERILILHQGAIGDFILSLPAIGTFRSHYPRASITIWGHPEILRLVDNSSYADHTSSLEQPGLASFYAEQGFESSPLAERFASFDTIVVFGGEQQAPFVDNLKKTDVEKVHHIFPFPPPGEKTHVIEFQSSQLSALGVPLHTTVPELLLSEAAFKNATCFFKREGLDQHTVTVALHPGSGSRKKAWEVTSFAALAEKLYSNHRAQIIVPVGPADEIVSEDYFKTVSSTKSIPLHNLPLDELAAILKQCSLYVGNDSGITHLAAAVGTPVVALFGPTDPEVWGPRGNCVSVLYGKTDCSPCSRQRMHECIEQRCLETLSVENVYGKVKDMLQDASN